MPAPRRGSRSPSSPTRRRPPRRGGAPRHRHSTGNTRRARPQCGASSFTIHLLDGGLQDLEAGQDPKFWSDQVAAPEDRVPVQGQRGSGHKPGLRPVPQREARAAPRAGTARPACSVAFSWVFWVSSGDLLLFLSVVYFLSAAALSRVFSVFGPRVGTADR